MKIILNGKNITTEEDFHRQISMALHFPEWYGGNLNALWDVLTGMIEKPIEIEWENHEASKEMIKSFPEIKRLLEDLVRHEQVIGRNGVFLTWR